MNLIQESLFGELDVDDLVLGIYFWMMGLSEGFKGWMIWELIGAIWS
jgi:hypothetical protein